jgi:hypothetical protein
MICLTTLSISQTVQREIEGWIGKDPEGSVSGPICGTSPDGERNEIGENFRADLGTQILTQDLPSTKYKCQSTTMFGQLRIKLPDDFPPSACMTCAPPPMCTSGLAFRRQEKLANCIQAASLVTVRRRFDVRTSSRQTRDRAPGLLATLLLSRMRGDCWTLNWKWFGRNRS